MIQTRQKTDVTSYIEPNHCLYLLNEISYRRQKTRNFLNRSVFAWIWA